LNFYTLKNRYKETVFLLLGGNIGTVKINFKKALALLANFSEILACSALYKTQAWGMPVKTPLFFNQAVKIQTALSPSELLKATQNIEIQMGRVREDGKLHYQNRTLDIDILLYGQKKIKTKELIIPHARLAARRFALMPLVEISSETIVPGINRTVSGLLEGCLDSSKVVRVEA
jgi:2-amino-4-hydroxy-6-hydroxymethyldihydropteridine diphosphokinase